MNPTQPQSVQDLGNLQQSVPGLLQNLKQNLVSIYQKDNPMIQARNNALSTFLSAGDVARNNLLPENQPMVEGRPLNYSPTAQNAIVESQKNAALAPLLGLNQSITAQYGTLGDILSQANNFYQGQIEAAKSKADYDYKYRELNQRNQGMGDFSNFFSQLGQQQQQQPPPLESFYYPDEQQPGANYGSQSLTEGTQPSWWDTILSWLGATPKQSWGQKPSALGKSLSGYGSNFNNMPIQLGIPQAGGLRG